MPCCVWQWVYLGQRFVKMVTQLMSRKIAFFINPISGTNNKTALLQVIDETCRAANIEYFVEPTNPAGNYHYFKKQIKLQSITDVVICGGDGTISAVLSSLRNSKVIFGIIPSGSGNGLALAAGIPVDVYAALHIILHGQANFVDAMLINDRFSCMMCGLGLDATVAHEFNKQKKRGLITYIKESLKELQHAGTYNFEIAINQKKILVNAYMISVACANQYGNHVTIAPRASLCDGLIDVIIVPEMTKAALVINLLKQIFLGKPGKVADQEQHATQVQYYQTRQLVIHNKQAALLHVDGDAAPTPEILRIKCLKAAYQLLQAVGA